MTYEFFKRQFANLKNLEMIDDYNSKQGITELEDTESNPDNGSGFDKKAHSKASMSQEFA